MTTFMCYDIQTPSSSDASWSRNSTVLVCPPASRHPTCRTCHKRIDTVRIGIIYTHMDGYILMRWYHVGCIAPPDDLMAHDIEGLGERAMRPYRSCIFEWLGRKTTKPRKLPPSLLVGYPKPPLAPPAHRPLPIKSPRHQTSTRRSILESYLHDKGHLQPSLVPPCL
ncbi:hypothetical protein SDRG_10703 [Saprolegnia diclina VS20]|uniref:PARP-type domain-containing protein n=1 Tax=Saprolegnia diclina (strain VS20) TaxID=1156394 RepID=T0Q129_SAPDV|nr:hypothetical protein SDRG_10703 [Saprolegnia diclina VS20]EQC31529.1 hypothetical protein SDRG_10703 [Saprolegnia diclina VS20]|eukprot:XP_008614928.1 hypothetical protein SDRG_10703 [Saprolegnia diclina VS20]